MEQSTHADEAAEQSTPQTPAEPKTPDVPAPPVQHWTRHAPWIALGIAVVVLVLDQLTKWWAEANLTLGERTPVLGDALGIQLIYNPGAAFSIGANATWVFTILAGVGVVAAAWFTWKVRSRAWAIALGLLLGGATTHFIDRLLRQPSFGQGHVVDFIAYFDWFIGNVADIALFGGVIVLLVLTARGFTLAPLPVASDAADAPEASEASEASEATDASAATDVPNVASPSEPEAK